MALTGSLGTFHHPGVSRIDYKPLDMDRVLTALLPAVAPRLPSKIEPNGDARRRCVRQAIPRPS